MTHIQTCRNTISFLGLLMLTLGSPATAAPCPETIVAEMKPGLFAFGASGEISLTPLVWDWGLETTGLLTDVDYQLTVGTANTYSDEVVLATFHVDSQGNHYDSLLSPPSGPRPPQPILEGTVVGLPPEYNIMRIRMPGNADQMIAGADFLPIEDFVPEEPLDDCYQSTASKSLGVGWLEPSENSFTPDASGLALIFPRVGTDYLTVTGRFRGLAAEETYFLTVGTSGDPADDHFLTLFVTDENGYGFTDLSLMVSHQDGLPATYDKFRVTSSTAYPSLFPTLVASNEQIKYLPTGNSTGGTCYRTDEFSEEDGVTMCAPGFGVRGITCEDFRCDNKVLTCCQYSDSPGSHLDWISPFASEEDGRQKGIQASLVPTSFGSLQDSLEDEAAQQSDRNKIMSGMKCRDSYCDDIEAHYSTVNEIYSFSDHEWTEFSFLYDDFIGCPEGKFATGFECSGRYCATISLRCSRPNTIQPTSFPVPNTDQHIQDLAEKFSPILYFDRDSDQHCYPSDPVQYYNEWRDGGDPAYYCNSSVNQNAPVYYEYQCSDFFYLPAFGCFGDEYIMYWFFYDRQNACYSGAGSPEGSHNADWERIMVKLTGGMLAEVKFWAHGKTTTMMRGYTSEVGHTHPVAFVGRKNHGSYAFDRSEEGGWGPFVCEHWNDRRDVDYGNPIVFNPTNILPVPAEGPDWPSADFNWDYSGEATIKGPKRGEIFKSIPVCEGPGCDYSMGILD